MPRASDGLPWQRSRAVPPVAHRKAPAPSGALSAPDKLVHSGIYCAPPVRARRRTEGLTALAQARASEGPRQAGHAPAPVVELRLGIARTLLQARVPPAVPSHVGTAATAIIVDAPGAPPAQRRSGSGPCAGERPARGSTPPVHGHTAAPCGSRQASGHGFTVLSATAKPKVATARQCASWCSTQRKK